MQAKLLAQSVLTPDEEVEVTQLETMIAEEGDSLADTEDASEADTTDTEAQLAALEANDEGKDLEVEYAATKVAVAEASAAERKAQDAVDNASSGDDSSDSSATYAAIAVVVVLLAAVLVVGAFAFSRKDSSKPNVYAQGGGGSSIVTNPHMLGENPQGYNNPTYDEAEEC